MAQKSPYEIRLDVLQMAKDYLDKLQAVNEQTAKDAFALAVKTNTEYIKAWQDFVPKTYTLEELTEKANELYKFVAPVSGTKND